ncbi:hypothetical protein SAMN04488540_103244 [Ferrimonas sediminum]|uniref:DUF962 domain-containing protein n=1 Tax=Ferrimonas sediminum TaxID=718193 RepID=A0A1G8NUZ6_9GAMM|nr:DUF962 domain-containing protein [Ferrimonas sediminum]SDI84052.1 hypothetical protein SAMN04488540_103244 [Ferrimonas sediminum]
MEQRFTSFQEFYPYYLGEHQDRRCRVLHYIGSTLVLLTAGIAVASGQLLLLLLLPVIGYGFAWAGHFGFEKNRPATFTYPFYSLLADWVMLKDAITGELAPKLKQLQAPKHKPVR